MTDKATLSLCPICLPFTLDSHFAPILERGDMRVPVIRCIRDGRCGFLAKRFLQSLHKYVIHVDMRFNGDGAVVVLLSYRKYGSISATAKGATNDVQQIVRFFLTVSFFFPL